MNISIIIPVYNAEKYLEDMINSIVNNMIKENNIEILFIDDNSTDLSKNIIKRYMNKYNFISLYENKENFGASISRNIGIENAKNDYIMFVDADDILDKEWFDIINYIEKDDDVIYFNENIDSNSSKSQMLKYIIGYNDENICIAGPFSKIFKKSFLLKNNIFFNPDLINGEDMIFNVNCLIKSLNYKIIKKSFYEYRVYVGQSTKSYNSKIIQSDLEFHNQLNNILDKSCIEENLKKELEEYSIQNAKLLIIKRISYCNSYKIAKKEYLKLNQYPYNISYEDNKLKKIGKRDKLILILFRLRQYKFVFWLSSKKNNIKTDEKLIKI